MGINLFSGNKLEILSQALSKVISKPLSTPFVPEVFIVQSKGMERFINLELAKIHGVAANLKFYFPNQFVNELYSIFLPETPEVSFYDKDVMTFKVMEILSGTLLENPEFIKVKNYIHSFNSDLKLYQISSQIADLFDQYILYRPEMIKQWERGGGNHWQAILFRELLKSTSEAHRIDLLQNFKKLVNSSDIEKKGMERINIFGISSIPQYHMEILSVLSSHVPVNFFAFNPCSEYWGDQLSNKEIVDVKRRSDDDEDIHIKQGNTLLSSMGSSGRDFFDMLNNYDTNEYNLYDSYGKDSLLTSIQEDIVNFTEDINYTLDRGDDSIMVHSCHSQSREIEVLKDNILRVLDSKDIKPEEIIVMAPDIENYTPYINSVFGPDKREVKTNIPYSISDRTAISESSIIEDFISLLKLSETRMEASSIMSLLESDSIMEKYEISDRDLGIIRKWIKESGIRWGIDAKHREKEGLPSYNSFSWDHGLKRMLTGYAMAGESEKLFMGVLPYDPIEGSYAETLGKLSSFTNTLFSYVRRFDGRKTVHRWALFLRDLLESFFIRSDETEKEFVMITDTIDDLIRYAELGSFDKEVNISVIVNYLSGSFLKKGFGGGFISRGVTFCSMLPMRSIPFKLICILGLSDNQFPGSTSYKEFDLIGKYPKKGDRSKRDDDRYLFLETIMSAKDMLYISYVGQSVKDNSNIPPSVLVSELVDYVEKKCSDKDIISRISYSHPLQPFSKEYFKGGKLFSYSKEYFDAAQSLSSDSICKIFAENELDDPPSEFQDIKLSSLLSFYKNPARFLLKKRGGILIDDSSQRLDDREPFGIAPLEAHILEKALFERLISDIDPTEYLRSASLSGNTPIGTPGECIAGEVLRKVFEISERVKGLIKISSENRKCKLDYKTDDFRVSGYLENIFDQMLHFRYGKTNGSDRLVAWIKHLFLNTAKGVPKESLLIELTFNKRSSRWDLALISFSEVENPESHIEDILKLYWTGLKKPLHFFPNSSYKYASTLFEKGKDDEYALKMAHRDYHGTAFNSGEKTFDPYGNICFRNLDPIDENFEELSKRVFENYFKYSRREKLQ